MPRKVNHQVHRNQNGEHIAFRIMVPFQSVIITVASIDRIHTPCHRLSPFPRLLLTITLGG